MKKMLFVYNPMAGKEQISTHLSNIVQVFCKASFEVTIFATAGPKDATRIVEERGTEPGVFSEIKKESRIAESTCLCSG